MVLELQRLEAHALRKDDWCFQVKSSL